jgi:DNA ligase-4
MYELTNLRVILDGEMIAWDPVNQAIIPFGSLKTAALTEKENTTSGDGIRPLCISHQNRHLTSDIIFDIVYINQTSLTRYPLFERRKALQRIINPIDRRFEVHKFTEANTVQDIETALRKIIAEGYILPVSPC